VNEHDDAAVVPGVGDDTAAGGGGYAGGRDGGFIAGTKQERVC